MASFLFPLAAEKLLKAELNWLTADIRAVLILQNTAISADTMVYLSDIPSGAAITKSPTITNRTATGGVAGSGAAMFSEFIDLLERPSDSVVLVLQGTTDADTLLVAYLDGGIGFPIVGAGRTYFVAPADAGWFSI
jgi:hypothetical protein